MRWGGPFILLALVKWRRADARLLAALACVPQTPVLYEVVPLFLLVRTFREATFLTVLMALVVKIVQANEHAAHLSSALTGADYNTWMALNGQWMVWLVYLPCTALVLCRPNEGLTLQWRTTQPDVAPESLHGLHVPTAQQTRRLEDHITLRVSDCHSERIEPRSGLTVVR
jgi:hypothetical protein